MLRTSYIRFSLSFTVVLLLSTLLLVQYNDGVMLLGGQILQRTMGGSALEMPLYYNSSSSSSSTPPQTLQQRAAAVPSTIKLGLATNTTITTTTTPATNSSFAYAFLMAGCDESGRYRGFLYNILVAAYILQESGSTGDIIVMVRMHATSNLTELPDRDASLLTKMGVQIRYLPLDSLDSFYSAMLAKFFILDYTEYERIVFMDSDVIPLCNLDYLHHMSMEGSIRENVVLSWTHEPAAGGFFMLKPGGKDELDSIARANRLYLKSQPGIRFDPVVGWGHVIQPPDSWMDMDHAFTNYTFWDFHGAFADQGLLYHWVKYHRKSYTQIYTKYVEDWGQDKYGNVTMLNVTTNDLPSCLPLKYHEMASTGRSTKFLRPPYRDFFHFTGDKKPWGESVGRSLLEDAENLQKDPPIKASILWVQTFGKVMKKINVNLTFSEILQRRNSAPLGAYPLLKDAMKHRTTFIDRR